MIAHVSLRREKRVGGTLWDGGGGMCLRKKEMRHMIVANPNSK